MTVHVPEPTDHVNATAGDVWESIDQLFVAAGFPAVATDDEDRAGHLVAHLQALVSQRDELRVAVTTVRVKAIDFDRQPRAVLQWIGRYCAIASAVRGCPRCAATPADLPGDDGDGS